MLIEPSVTGKVVVALQDGFYGASSGSGFSNRDFLIALTRLLPPDRLVVVSVRGYSDPIDPFWTAQLLKSLRRAKAQTVLVNHCGEDSAHGRDLLTEMVASVVSGEDRCLVVGLDRSLLGLAADDNRDLLLVPRSTAALTCADLSEIIWERDCLHTAVKSGGHVVAISDFMRRHLRDDYGLPGDALVVMPNGLLLDDDAPSEQANALPRPAEEGFLLSHGRAVPDKGFEDLLAALEILRSRRVPVPHLVLAATAPGPTTAYQRHLARVIEDSHVDATLVTEFNPRIRAWMSSPVLRGIVVPSRREPFGRIPLEAFAAGAGPVIATRAGGLPETVVDGCTGFTAEPHDPASLADAIHRGLTVTPSERVHLVKAGGALLHERHDYLANIQAALAAVAPLGSVLEWGPVRVTMCLTSDQDFWQLSREHVDHLRSNFPDVDLRVATPATVPNELRASEVYFGWRFAPTWLSLAPSLRWIASPAAGTDHLPVRQAHQAGVMLTRSYGFHGRPMSEHAMGLVLGFSRGLFTSSRLQLTRRWWKDELAAEFFDLAGATMTIVGCGSVGAHLARAAGAFRMNVIGVRRTPPADAEGGIRWVRASSIRGAVAKADVVVGLLPATAETAGFFDQRVFNSCKPGAIFINLGRASTVDHTALLQALEDGPLGGAALDVTTPRPLPMEDALRLHPRVILTPKSATFSRSYMDEAIAFFADNLRRYLNDLPLHGLATPPREG